MISTIVLAAGGTGGHIFPAEAVAYALAKKGYKIIFITDKAGRKFDRLPSSVQVMVLPLHRRSNSLTGIIKFVWGLAKSMYHVYRGFKIMKPTVVVGFGGYPSFPAVAVAQALGIPTIVHEQNAVLGQVNRMLGSRAKCVILSFKATEHVKESFSTVLTGTPVRDTFYNFRDTNYTFFEKDQLIRLLITGGSQGASIFSKVLPKAIGKLSEVIRQRILVTHQCPANDMEQLGQYYNEAHINAKITPFIDNMAEEMSAAHLVIARAGASTLAELAIVGRPAILVPFPSAKDNHQWVNAQTVSKVGAGWCVDQQDFTEEYLTRQLESLFYTPKTLYDAALNMKALGQPLATENIVKIIELELGKD